MDESKEIGTVTIPVPSDDPTEQIVTAFPPIGVEKYCYLITPTNERVEPYEMGNGWVRFRAPRAAGDWTVKWAIPQDTLANMEKHYES